MQIHRQRCYGIAKGLREIQICYFCQLWNSNASVNTLHSINKVFYDTIYNTGIVLNIFVFAVLSEIRFRKYHDTEGKKVKSSCKYTGSGTNDRN
jgi:hypothetical protein